MELSHRLISRHGMPAAAIGYALAGSACMLPLLRLLDIPLLLASQVRLVLRIAAVHGESLSVRHARELLTTMAGSVALRYLAAQLGKLIPGPGWLIAGAVTGLGTWAMGRVAVAYFESGKRLTPEQLRQRYKRLLRRPRSASEG